MGHALIIVTCAYLLNCQRTVVYKSMNTTKAYPITQKFENNEWCKLLQYRAETMLQMIAHVERAAKAGLTQIIETGTARKKHNWNGDGQSTLVWDWLAKEIKGLKVLSIDISEQAVFEAQEQTTKVDFHIGDSITHLESLSAEILSKVGLLYLDSMDYYPGQRSESELHHLKELNTVWDKLPSGCLIVIDDCKGIEEGKHVEVAKFMKKENIEQAFIGYQTGWRKP